MRHAAADKPLCSLHIKVKVKGEQTFRGVLIQAHKTDGSRIGTFSTTDTNVKPRQCDTGVDSALTHANRDDKTEITATWTAPHDDEMGDQGEIEFV